MEVLARNNCPEGFDIMNSANFTTGVCVPLSSEYAKQADKRKMGIRAVILIKKGFDWCDLCQMSKDHKNTDYQ